jgi:hypothetical protein
VRLADSASPGDHSNKEVVMAHHPDSSSSGPYPETVYYRERDSGTLVTSERILTDHGHFLVRDLAKIQRMYGSAHPARKVAPICALLELGLAVLLAALYGAVPLLYAGCLLAAGLAAAIFYDSRHHPRWMTLVAVHRGRAATIYSSTSELRFEQVCRAVLRATEAAGRPPGTDVIPTAAPRARPLSSRARPHRYDRRSVDPA